MNQHSLSKTHVNVPSQALLATLALAAFGINVQAKKAEVTLHSATAADGDPNYTKLLTKVDTRRLAASAGITNTGPVLLKTLPTTKAFRRAGAVMTTSHGRRQVSPVPGRYTLN